jgi:hypothetical protein
MRFDLRPSISILYIFLFHGHILIFGTASASNFPFLQGIACSGISDTIQGSPPLVLQETGKVCAHSVIPAP